MCMQFAGDEEMVNSTLLGATRRSVPPQAKKQNITHGRDVKADTSCLASLSTQKHTQPRVSARG